LAQSFSRVKRAKDSSLLGTSRSSKFEQSTVSTEVMDLANGWSSSSSSLKGFCVSLTKFSLWRIQYRTID